jgi:hypothetical protein
MSGLGCRRRIHSAYEDYSVVVYRADPPGIGTHREAQLRRHLAAAPPEREGNTDLLAQLPHAEVDLNALAGNRLGRFLHAFRVEIHYDVRTGRTYSGRRSAARCSISSPTDPSGRSRGSVHAHARLDDDAKEEGGEDSPLIIGSSFRLCPGGIQPKTAPHPGGC